MKKVKTKTLRDYKGNKFKSIVEERKSLKDLIEYEISETYERDKETDKIYQKIRKLEEELEKTISVKENKLVNEIVELYGEVSYCQHKSFYNAFWDMISHWNK